MAFFSIYFLDGVAAAGVWCCLRMLPERCHSYVSVRVRPAKSMEICEQGSTDLLPAAFHEICASAPHIELASCKTLANQAGRGGRACLEPERRPQEGRHAAALQ